FGPGRCRRGLIRGDGLRRRRFVLLGIEPGTDTVLVRRSTAHGALVKERAVVAARDQAHAGRETTQTADDGVTFHRLLRFFSAPRELESPQRNKPRVPRARLGALVDRQSS